MLRQGKIEDIDALMMIVKDTVTIMAEEQNDQWNDTYPNVEIFTEDVDNVALYVMEKSNNLIGSITVDQNEPLEYKGIPWENEGPAYTFHRLVVDPNERGSGIASQLIQHAEKIAIKNGVPYLRIDTYSLNRKAQRLFMKLGYKKAGEMSFHGRELPFYCYEKKL
ncbi:GNAT family N-acetyltransferase [Robertmurraya massiliosenegalensis]|uniref:GNAT family N-acetyltransferase n=1 Tax=Robertmurraya massiliosenegalensis TaxID=1287657 RepID=UPI0002DFB4F6|nr:GNAT family N-acetyltransferase [Robertmurraya massiliosenegalensis]